MKNITIAVVLALGASGIALPVSAQTTPPPVTNVQTITYSDAELDSLLAPIALYPDTLLTHILVATTYPLDVVSADRWRQSNRDLSPDQVEQLLEPVDWDPSVKALVPFTDVLNTIAEDLNWLQQLGDNVLISQSRVLARVQVLRQHAMNTGNLQSNDYLEVEREKEVVYIAPRQREVVYVPYYDPVTVYGHWWHPIAPVRWNHHVSYHRTGSFYWGPSIRLSTFFYFGGIHWSNRHVVIHRTPVTRYFRGSQRKRVISNGYQRWEHRQDHRRAKYSERVVRSAPAVYQHRKQPVSRNYVPKNTNTRGVTNKYTHAQRVTENRVSKHRENTPVQHTKSQWLHRTAKAQAPTNREQTIKNGLRAQSQKPARYTERQLPAKVKDTTRRVDRKQSIRDELRSNKQQVARYSKPRQVSPSTPRQQTVQQKVQRQGRDVSSVKRSQPTRKERPVNVQRPVTQKRSYEVARQEKRSAPQTRSRPQRNESRPEKRER